MWKLKLQYLTILWKTRWVGGGAQAVLEIQVEGGGLKNVPSIGGGGWIFSGITQLAPTSANHPLPFKKTEVGKKKISHYFL